MLSSTVSRALLTSGLVSGLLTGCMIPSVTPTKPQAVVVNTPSVAEHWINQMGEVQQMTTPQIEAELAKLRYPADHSRWFYKGLLKQQLSNYGAWIAARDIFQKLEEDLDLSLTLRQLSGIMRQFNQVRINSYLKRRDLLADKRQLSTSLDLMSHERDTLQEKIRALTALETAISTRKED